MRFRPWLPLTLALIGGASPLLAVTPHLVKDINPIPQEESSGPADFRVIGGLAFFTASDGEAGTELWRTDGTLPGTFQVADACPGECSSRYRLAAFSDRSYFFLAFGASGKEDLWVTDGTPAGTVRLTTSLSFPLFIGWQVWVASQKLLYFAADDGIHGLELWRSDGTPGGTFLVTDLRPGPEGSGLDELRDFNGRVFFRANDGQQGPGLWSSDGTPQGTRLVQKVPDPVFNLGPQFLRVAGRTLFFISPTSSGAQLWRSDGTTRGTVPLINLQIRRGAGDTFRDFRVFNNRLFFVADTKGPGQELWVTDGTVKGTRPLTNFARTDAFSSPSILLLPFQSQVKRMVFLANDGPHGVEPWVTDGTPRGTKLLRDVCPGACSGASPGLAVDGNLLYFEGTDGVHGLEPWVTDGTAAGTRMLRDLCNGSCSSLAYAFQPAGGRAYFLAYDEDHILQVWRSDGTSSGTLQLTRFESEGSLFPFFGPEFGVLGSELLFSANDGTKGFELWRSDGTPAGTGLLANLNTRDAGGSFPTELTAVGDKVYFYASDGQANGLWKSDGSEAGTVPVLQPTPGDHNHLSPVVEAGGTLFFFTLIEGEDRLSLWRTDGTANGTFRLSPSGAGFPSQELTPVGNSVYFVGSDEDHGEELWVTDGTVAGTRLVTDLEPGFSPSAPGHLTAFQGRLYFTARTSLDDIGLWRTDGTEAGTVLIKGSFSPSSPDLLTEHAGQLWFMANDGEHGRELWSTDGTAAGTRLHELIPGFDGLLADDLIWAGDRLFLSGGDTNVGIGLWVWDGTPAGAHRISDAVFDHAPFGRSKPVVTGGILYFSGFQLGSGSPTSLWKSDGTQAGTVQVLDSSGSPISDPEFFRVLAGRVFFTTLGRLFETDGTAAGTFPLLELKPFSGPQELVAAGPRLFFRKWDPATGSELWALEAN